MNKSQTTITMPIDEYENLICKIKRLDSFLEDMGYKEDVEMSAYKPLTLLEIMKRLDSHTYFIIEEYATGETIHAQSMDKDRSSTIDGMGYILECEVLEISTGENSLTIKITSKK